MSRSSSSSGSTPKLNRWVRQAHRWLSIAFTVAVLANFVALGLEKQVDWVGLLALPPLAVLLLTGLYLFVLPYLTKSRSSDGVSITADPR